VIFASISGSAKAVPVDTINIIAKRLEIELINPSGIRDMVEIKKPRYIIFDFPIWSLNFPMGIWKSRNGKPETANQTPISKGR